MKITTSRPRWTCVGLVLTVLAFYWSLVSDHHYVWDDWLLFVNDPSLRLPEHFWRRIFEPVLWGSSYFRPLVVGTFGVELMAVGTEPTVAHATNVLLHGINCGLVLLLAQRLLLLRAGQAAARHQVLALLPALMYAVHPALVESVAWISGRFDLMVTTFMLGSLLAFLRLTGWTRALAFAGLMFAALLCKEMAITLPAMAMLLHAWSQPTGVSPRAGYVALWSSDYRPCWYLAGLTVLTYLLLRWWAFGVVMLAPHSPSADADLLQRLALTGQAIIFYLKATWLPYSGTVPFDFVKASTFSTQEIWSGLCALLASFAILCWAGLRNPRHPAALGVAAWLVALSPVLHIIPLPIATIGHDRFLTFPLVMALVGLVGLDGWWDQVFNGDRRKLTATVAIAAAWLAAATLAVCVTAPVWKHDIAFWAWAYEKRPTSKDVLNNFMAAAVKQDQLDLAQKILEEAEAGRIETNPLNVGLLRVKQGRAEEALQILNKFERDSNSPHAAANLPPDYLDTFKAPINTQNGPARLYGIKAESYFMLGDYENSLRSARIALLYHPTSATAMLLKSLSLYALGRPEEASSIYASAVRYASRDSKSEFAARRAALFSLICAPPSPTLGEACRTR